VLQLANTILTHDWIGSGRSIASQIVSGLSNIGSMARGALDDISSWVSSGGARSAGENLANWIINGAQAVFGAGVDLLGWLRTNLTMDKVRGIVSTAFNMGSELVKLGVQAGTDFIGGISKAVTDSAGGYFEGVMTAGRKLVTDIKGLGVDIAKAGVNWVIDAIDGVIASLSGALAPIITAFNQLTGKNVTLPTSSGISKYEGVDVAGKWDATKQSFGNFTNALNPFEYAKKQAEMQQAQTYGLTGVQGDPLAAIRQLAAQGVPYNEALKMAKSTVQNNSAPDSEYLKAYEQAYNAANMGSATSAMFGQQGGFGLWNASNIPGGAAGTLASKTATDKSAVSALEKDWGKGVVPVSVTNWPSSR
jgi:hypothetical protein